MADKMRIYEIIVKSLKLPFKKYHLFILALIVALIFETVTHIVYENYFGEFDFAIILLYTIFTFFVFGILLNLSNDAILHEKFELDAKEHFTESIKEYCITLYYLLLTVIFSSILMSHMIWEDEFSHVYNFISNGDWSSVILTFHEFVHQLPISLQIDLFHLQLDVLSIVVILIFISSLGFIGKVVAIRSKNFINALDLRIIFSIVKEIGLLRYILFLFVIIIISVLTLNLLLFLEVFLSDIVISAILEVFILFFVINAFYLIIDDSLN